MSVKIYVASSRSRKDSPALIRIITEMRTAVAAARIKAERARFRMRQVVAEMRRNRGE